MKSSDIIFLVALEAKKYQTTSSISKGIAFQSRYLFISTTVKKYNGKHIFKHAVIKILLI